MEHADRHNTRPAVERQEYKVGDLVDLWYETPNKDMSGWRGPEKVHSLQPSHGRGGRPLPGTVARPEGTGGEATHPVLGLF